MLVEERCLSDVGIAKDEVGDAVMDKIDAILSIVASVLSILSITLSWHNRKEIDSLKAMYSGNVQKATGDNPNQVIGNNNRIVNNDERE